MADVRFGRFAVGALGIFCLAVKEGMVETPSNLFRSEKPRSKLMEFKGIVKGDF